MKYIPVSNECDGTCTLGESNNFPTHDGIILNK